MRERPDLQREQQWDRLQPAWFVLDLEANPGDTVPVPSLFSVPSVLGFLSFLPLRKQKT